jgi:hypothetical protein
VPQWEVLKAWSPPFYLWLKWVEEKRHDHSRLGLHGGNRQFQGFVGAMKQVVPKLCILCCLFQ